MQFWRRISQSNLKHLSYQLKRTYLQIPHASSFNYIAAHARTSIADKQCCVTPKRTYDFCNNVRFFAAPPQSNPTQKEKSQRRMNEQITSPMIRLVTDEGNEIISTMKALKLAREQQLDLVEVGGLEDPPVCKILDLKRLKRLQLAKQKELKIKKKSEVTLRSDIKEVRFNRKIAQKDLKLKADQIKKMMERGYRVKVAAVVPEKIDLENRELVKFEDQHLKDLMARFYVLVEDAATVESEQLTSGRQIVTVLRHKKFGPLKSGKKTTTVTLLENSDPVEENPIPQVASPLQEMPRGADAANSIDKSAAASPPSPLVPENSSYKWDVAAPPLSPRLPENSSYNRAAAATPPLPSYSSVPKVENRYSKRADPNDVNRGARDSGTNRYEPRPQDSNQRRRWN